MTISLFMRRKIHKNIATYELFVNKNSGDIKIVDNTLSIWQQMRLIFSQKKIKGLVVLYRIAGFRSNWKMTR